ncbi:MAG TPA: 50S ribosomal protein L4 [Candidatus Paceibacterota bacterium]|nr:50S ribosomal protein L4 [Candidatus Paceibacterota bacterium]
MDITVYNPGGSKKATLSAPDRLFKAKMNADLVYQVATIQMSNMRTVIAHAKTRAEVAGGGKKPWQQKGTGRARHGSIRSPLWVGGGVSHGPSKDVNFKKKLGKSQQRAALASVLSSRVAEGNFLVTQSFEVASGKTKDAVKLIGSLTAGFPKYTAGGRILLVLAGEAQDAATRRATDNIPHVQTIRAADLNTLTLLSFPYIIASAEAVGVIEKTFK